MFSVLILYTTFLSLTCMPLQLSSARVLNHFVGHYEPLTYEPIDVSGRARWKRSAHRRSRLEEHSVEIAFTALNREFRLRLVRDRSSFTDDFVLVTNRGPGDVYLDHLYSGHVVGHPDSRVVGSIMGGVFVGRIALPWEGEEYHVERANRFFPNGTSSFHSVLYSSRDVLKTSDGPFCGVRSATMLHRPKRSVLPFDPLPVVSTGQYTALRGTREVAYDSHSKRSGATPRRPGVAVVAGFPSNVSKAGTKPRSKEDVRLKRVCNLKISVDHTLFTAVLSDMSGDEVKAKDVLTSMISAHTATASEIFSNTDFGGIVDISFAVQRVEINESDACEGGRWKTNPFCREDLDATHLLHTLSYSNHDGYCASILWTHRVLPKGLLGIAFVADADADSGGICETYRNTPVDGREALGGYTGRRSLNTALVTFQNHNGRVPQRTSLVTFTHELGHNFGANHDVTVECAPGGDLGNYIMFPSAQQGKDPNNYKFSACSIGSISLVLKHLFAGEWARDNCLLIPRGPFCGNLIREGREQCDCGYQPSQCKDRCCRPRSHRKPCTLAPGAICSWQNRRSELDVGTVSVLKLSAGVPFCCSTGIRTTRCLQKGGEMELHYPSQYTEEEEMLLKKYQCLKLKKKALQQNKTPKPEPPPVQLQTTVRKAIPAQDQNSGTKPESKPDAKEVAKMLLKSGAIRAIKVENKERHGFKRSKASERKRSLNQSYVASHPTEDNSKATGSAASSSRPAVKPLYESFVSGGILDEDDPKHLEASRDSELEKPWQKDTLFVYGAGVSEEHLRGAFAPFGTILNIYMEPDKNCGFVTFEKIESAEKAAGEMNGATVSGTKLRVSFARKKPLTSQQADGTWTNTAVNYSQKGGHADTRNAVPYKELDMF